MMQHNMITLKTRNGMFTRKTVSNFRVSFPGFRASGRKTPPFCARKLRTLLADSSFFWWVEKHTHHHTRTHTHTQTVVETCGAHTQSKGTVLHHAYIGGGRQLSSGANVVVQLKHRVEKSSNLCARFFVDHKIF
jgi:hypothetical protein